MGADTAPQAGEGYCLKPRGRRWEAGMPTDAPPCPARRHCHDHPRHCQPPSHFPGHCQSHRPRPLIVDVGALHNRSRKAACRIDPIQGPQNGCPSQADPRDPFADPGCPITGIRMKKTPWHRLGSRGSAAGSIRYPPLDHPRPAAPNRVPPGSPARRALENGSLRTQHPCLCVCR